MSAFIEKLRRERMRRVYFVMSVPNHLAWQMQASALHWTDRKLERLGKDKQVAFDSKTQLATAILKPVLARKIKAAVAARAGTK